MEFNKFDPKLNKSIGFRHIEVESKYNMFKSNATYFKTDISSKLFSKYQPYSIRKNNFPYFWEDAEHYVIWINPTYEKLYNNEKIIKIINYHFFNNKIKFWENQANNRSVPNIKHLHIIVEVSSKKLIHY